MSILSLPVEIFHRIFDNLDAKTILISVPPVSRLFYFAVNSYNRYNLDMKLISKSDLYLLYRLIHPANIISIALFNADQIDFFISTVRLQELTRLRSLTILDIKQCQLDIILKHIEFNCLTSFSFRTQDRGISKKTIENLLLPILKKSKLRKLECDGSLFLVITWSINHTIQYLKLNSFILIPEFSMILEQNLHLETLIVQDIDGETFSNTIKKPFHNLTSLTIENFTRTMDNLESVLLLTPSLVYFKLICDNGEMMNGNRWEKFIEIHLPYLNKFEFFFGKWQQNARAVSIDMNSIVTSFQTLFWIEHKKWFVTCEYDSPRNYIILYSLPTCISSLDYRAQHVTISLSTCQKENSIMINNIKSLTLSLDQSLADHIRSKGTTVKSPLFPNVTDIAIEITNEWPLRPMQALSMLVDFSQIVHVVWDTYFYDDGESRNQLYLNFFFQQAQNLSSLVVWRYSVASSATIDSLCSILPHCLKHLQMPLTSVEQINKVMEQCDNLYTIHFLCKNVRQSMEVIEWFASNTINSTCYKIDNRVCVWLGKKTIQKSIENRSHNRRFKLFSCCSKS